MKQKIVISRRSACQLYVLIFTVIGKGIPNQLAAENSRVSVLDTSNIPSTIAAASLFRNRNGRLSVPIEFGVDPLNGHHQLSNQRQRLMDSNLPPTEYIFGSVVNNSYQDFACSLKYMIDVTNYLTRFI